MGYGNTSFLNQPIVVPALRGLLRAPVGETGHPPLVRRNGYGHSGRPSSTREVDDVLRG
jgi:hypothetical protein